VRHSISHPPALQGRTLLDGLNHRIKNEQVAGERAKVIAVQPDL
jgi:hypothetical protein